MAIYLANAFSLGMLNTNWAMLYVRELNVEEVKEYLQKGFTSVVGHESTARLLTQLLNIDVAFNRVEIRLNPGDIIIVFQLQTRLPEGAILSEEQLKAIKYKFYMIQVRQ